MPYATCELETWSVVQLTVAVVAVMPLEVTKLITGIDAAVEKVRLEDVAVPAEFVDMTAKL